MALKLKRWTITELRQMRLRTFVSFACVVWAIQPARAQTADSLWRAATPPPVPVTRRLLGNPPDSGAFRYYYQAPPGAALSAHRHTADMHITVRFGRKFILMGRNLDTAHVQRFDAGASFVIPAGVWHVEWWETDTLEDITGVGPMTTQRASPAAPRQP